MSSPSQENGRIYSPQYLAHLETKGRNRETDQKSTPTEKLIVILSAGLLGIAFDYFFNGQRFGISVPIFALLIIAAIHVSFKGYKQPRLSSFLLIASLLLCISYGIYNNASLRFLNGLAILLGITAYTLSARYGAWKNIYVSSIGTLVRKLVPQSLESAPKFILFSLQGLTAKPSEGTSATRSQILRGLMLSVPLLAVVLILLTSSDAVFSRMFTDRLTFLQDLQLDRIISHTLLISMGTLYFFGYLWSLKYDVPGNDSPLLIRKDLESVTALTVMSLLCAVYLLFTLIQFTYLYSAGASLPTGLSYAVYARRGFFELLAAAFVNMAVILSIASKTKDSHAGLNNALLVCNSLMTAFTLNLLVSAFYRMHLYEAAYGFTELRLFVQFFMAFMAVSLLALMVWIWKREFPLFKTALIAAVTVYVALNYVNVDRLIAHNNLERYQLTHQVDIYHLSWLSVDAWPEIAGAQLDAASKKQLLDDFRMQQTPAKEQHDRWFEYNYHLNRFLQAHSKQPI